MSIASALGFTSDRKVRYAVVGLGDISQEAMLPGIAHTGNSVVVALVTEDSVKARDVGKRYDVAHTCGYDGFDALIRSGTIDAIYLGTPNWRHAEFAIPALQAGIHVLCEKPLEISVEKCEQIRAAQATSSAKLMVAYRLHFEPSTLDSIARIRDGEIGEPIAFSSYFAQMLDPENHRAKNGVLAGPLYDMGPYPINAARYLFGDEPDAVLSATATRHPEAGFGDLDDTVAVTLRFPGNRFAQFIVTYYANAIGTILFSGTKGSIELKPAYGYGQPHQQVVTIGEKTKETGFKATDQFGGQMRYFSDCILDGRDPEPDAEEGLADLRVIEGVLKALETGQPQTLPPFKRARRIDVDAQKQTLSMVSPPDPVHASGPARD